MKVSDFYTVIIDGEEIELAKFIKMFDEKTFATRWIDYDSDTKQFKVCMDGEKVVNLDLPEDVSEDVFKQIMSIVARYKVYVMKENISKKVMETGALPTNKTEIAYYKEHLEEELKKAKYAVAGNCLVATVPFAFATLTFIGGKSFFDICAGYGDPSFLNIFLSFIMMSFCGIETLNMLPILTDPDMKKGFENYKLIKTKLKALKAHEAKLKSGESFSDFVLEEDKKDNTKVEQNKDKFLTEFKIIMALLEQLPRKEQVKYRLKLSELLLKYQVQVNTLLDKNKGEIVLGEAEDVWQIFIDILPELNKIHFDIQEEIEKTKQKHSFNAEVEDLQKALSAGYTDGWTDELTDSGVAYKKMG